MTEGAPAPGPTEGPSDGARAIGLGLAAALLYLVTAPGVVNLDGLGYLKLLPHNFAAGHLLYMPVLRTGTRLLGGDGLMVGRLINALLGATGVLLTFGIARRVAPLKSDRRLVATIAAAGLGCSYGYWVQGSDVEAYALATVALLCVVRIALPYRTRPSAVRAFAMGLALGLAVLCHLTHVLLSAFVVAICLEDPRGRRQGLLSAGLALFTGGAVSLLTYAWAAFVVRGHHLEGAIRWVLSASHGFRESSGPYALAEAIYGLSRSLVWSPYLYESDAPRLLAHFLLGLVALGMLVHLGWRGRRALMGLPHRPFLAWALPYAVMGLLFFGADTERWIFVLPLLWIVGAVAIDALAARRLVGSVLVGALFVLNLALAILPAHRDGWARHLAELGAEPLADGDLLLFPGHAWDEYVSFYGGKRIEPFPIAYYAARDGEARMWARLDREVAATRARGHRVFAARLFDEDREVADDPAGYAELRAIGLSRASLRAKLEARFAVAALPVRDGVSIVVLGARPDPVAVPPSP